MALSASEARKRLYPLIEQVNDDDEAVEIVSSKGTAYLVPAEQWRSMNETLHLLRTPANALRLMQALQDVRNGVNVETHELIDPDAVEANAS